MVSLRSIFFINDRSTLSSDPEALDGQNFLTLVTLDHL